MKKLYILLALLVLASCGQNKIVTTSTYNNTAAQETSQEIKAANEIATTSTPKNIVVQETSQEIEGAISELSETEKKPERPARGGKAKESVPDAIYEGGEITDTEVQEGKVVELSTTYISPKTEVIMNISYTLDDDNTFSKIAVTSPNYTHMTKFNNGIQNIIGMTIEEADGYNVAGSTLGSVAFSKVLKDL